ncbi:MAG TPA: glycosyltransferase, partial [Puia sp.]|nr:glycosyltransferase [Puia sp.]
MSEQILISICIPAYKRIDHLKRLLDSIRIQLFKNFEVIVTDDSPAGEVGVLCEQYKEHFPLIYHRNAHPLGTPENWNESIRRANGKWIKLMHDDDWFTAEDSLGVFADTATAHPSASFIFSAYRNVSLETEKTEDIFVDNFRLKMLCKNPASLVSRNVIGPPSVILHKNDRRALYDNKLKWLVDIDFYMRSLAGRKPVYIDRILVNVGTGEFQVTTDCFRLRPVEIPENFYLLNKTG